MNFQLPVEVFRFTTELGLSISQVLYIEDLIVIRLDTGKTLKYGDDFLDQNIYAFSLKGEYLWQIEAAPISRSPKPYVNLQVIDDKLVADNWLGISFVLNIENGRVEPYKSGIRPW